MFDQKVGVIFLFHGLGFCFTPQSFHLIQAHLFQLLAITFGRSLHEVKPIPKFLVCFRKCIIRVYAFESAVVYQAKQDITHFCFSLFRTIG